MAVMVRVRADVTAYVAIVKVAVVCPEGIFTMPGVDAKEVPLEVTVTLTPVTGAGLPSVMVPCKLAPPVTAVGSRVSCTGGTTETCWVMVLLPGVAVRVADCGVVTVDVGIVKFAVALFTWMVTEAGGLSTVLLLVT